MNEQLQLQYDDSKKRLNDLAERHRKAVLFADSLKVQWDDAQAEANRLLEALNKENEVYMELEKQVEAEKNAKKD
jgi:Mn-dependent DtxR family transcriptional regulator